jgi:hypothetical protein
MFNQSVTKRGKLKMVLPGMGRILEGTAASGIGRDHPAAAGAARVLSRRLSF